MFHYVSTYFLHVLVDTHVFFAVTIATLAMCLQLMSPSQTFSRVHGNSGVTDVRCHGDSVYSCGRNGRYCQFAVANGNQLQLISNNKVQSVIDDDDDVSRVTTYGRNVRL